MSSNLGKVFVASGPSGTGKTTLCRLVEQRLNIPHCVSYTTRSARPNEIDGKDYCFVSFEKFNEMKDAGLFLEWALVHGNYYATSKSYVLGRIEKGLDTILDVDVQGAKQILEQIPEAILIFIDLDHLILSERLMSRGTESNEKVNLRLEEAMKERQQKHLYHYIVENHDLEVAFKEIEAIITHSHV